MREPGSGTRQVAEQLFAAHGIAPKVRMELGSNEAIKQAILGGVGVSILSYGGGVQFGLMTDAGLCPQPQQIIDRFAPEFETLVLATMMLPWVGEAA